MMGKIGIAELLVILVIVLIIFGPKQLPKLSRMFGKTVKEFKDGLDEEDAPAEDKPASAKAGEGKPSKPETESKSE